MSRFTLTQAISAATLVLALAGSPALAQVKPIPNPKPALKPAPTPKPPQQPKLPTPSQPVTIKPRPILAIVATPASAHRVATLTVQLNGLGDARAVHLYGFDPGCDVGQLAVSGLTLRRDVADAARMSSSGQGRVSYSSDEFPGRQVAPHRPGLAVTNGSATITMLARIGGGIPLSPREEVTGQVDDSLPQVNDYASRGLAAVGQQTCTPRAVLIVQGADGVWRNLRADGSLTSLTQDTTRAVTGLAWRVQGGQMIRHTSSTAARDILKPSMKVVRPGSACNGVSTAPGSQHPVGVLEDGGDLVFRIRSGPIGTHCRLLIPTRPLNDGTRVTVSFSVRTTGSKCRVGAPAAPISAPGGFALNRSEGTRLAPIRPTEGGRIGLSWSGWINPNGHTSADRISPRTVLSAMEMDLFCEITAINDHAIEVRLDEVEYILPDGAPMPV